MKFLALLAVPLSVLAACAPAPLANVPPQTAPSENTSGLAWARIGETVNPGGPTVTPLRLVEDSRCPQGVQCVWAGRVVVNATISTPTMTLTRDLVLGEPFPVADGTLTLAEVQPVRGKNAAPAPADYRFGFRFDGGF